MSSTEQRIRLPVDRLGYSTTEFATAFGCTRQHVHNLIRRGEIRTISLGRRRVIPRTEVDRLLEGGGAPDGDAAA
jgi:excisionase family DNA binding protein